MRLLEGYRAALAVALFMSVGGQASAQQPESRIDPTPRLELRPPPVDPSGVAGGVPREGGSQADTVPDHDRHMQLELDQNERRDALRPKGGGSGEYLALGVIVAGTGLVLLLVVVWGSRRRTR